MCAQALSCLTCRGPAFPLTAPHPGFPVSDACACRRSGSPWSWWLLGWKVKVPFLVLCASPCHLRSARVTLRRPLEQPRHRPRISPCSREDCHGRCPGGDLFLWLYSWPIFRGQCPGCARDLGALWLILLAVVTVCVASSPVDTVTGAPASGTGLCRRVSVATQL